MCDVKYVGIDLHAASCAICVMNQQGQVFMRSVVATQAETLRAICRGLTGEVHVVLEEGTLAAWVREVLQSVVCEVVVSNPRANRLLSVGNKTDTIDAEKLAHLLRLQAIKPVYKVEARLQSLKELVQGYEALVGDVTRCKNRLQALYRGRGLSGNRLTIYQAKYRHEWLAQLPEGGRQQRAAWLYEELDVLQRLRREAKRALLHESGQWAEQALLLSIPGIGPVRAAQLLARVGTARRFRTKRQFWSYCGLALRVRTSSEYEVREQRLVRKQKVQQTQGLTREYSRPLKAVFKGAGEDARRRDPFKAYYESLLAKGQRPEMARLTLARKLAAIVLKLWKGGELFQASAISASAH